MLPYASYLRVYEPVDHPPASGSAAGRGDAPLETVATLTLEREQMTVLTKVIASAAPPRAHDDLAGCYLLRRDGRLLRCPVDLALRSWLALASFVEETEGTTQRLFFLPDHSESAAAEFADWRTGHPTAVPHIREATWGVPRTWFLLVRQGEREHYDLDGCPSVRFTVPIAQARERLASASGLLGLMVDDAELLDELDDLTHWLADFPDGSWLELDYAGVARLLGDALGSDASAEEITTALAAIEGRDFATAGDAYHRFVERWRVVNALARAN